MAATRAANQGPDTGAQHLVSATFRCGVEDDFLSIVVAIVCDFLYLLYSAYIIGTWNTNNLIVC